MFFSVTTRDQQGGNEEQRKKAGAEELHCFTNLAK
jgi:hypothetical protein